VGTSSIASDGRAVWCPDSLIELFAALLAEQLRRDESSQLLAYAEYLTERALAGTSGCIDLEFDALDMPSKQLVARAAAAVAELVLHEPERLSVTALARLGLVGYERDVAAEHVVMMAEVVIALLRGEWRWSAADEQALPCHWLHRKHHDA